MALFRDCGCAREPAAVIQSDGSVRVACDRCNLAVQARTLTGAAEAWNSLDLRGSVAMTPHPGGTAAEGG